jgi:hypothetical protein
MIKELNMEETQRTEATEKNSHKANMIKRKSDAKYGIAFTVPDTVAKSKNIKQFADALTDFYDKSDRLQKDLLSAIDLIGDDDKFNRCVKIMIENYTDTYDFVIHVIESRNSLDDKAQLLYIRMTSNFNHHYNAFMKALDNKRQERLNELRSNSFFD